MGSKASKRPKGRLLGLVVALFWTLSASLYAQEWTLTPGEAVGTLTLGATQTQIEAVLNPTEIIGPTDEPLFVKYSEQLFCQYKAGEVIMISLLSNTFSTNNGKVTIAPYQGLSIGVPWEPIAARIPGPKRSSVLRGESYHAYLQLGLGVRVKNGSVAQIDIWRPQSPP